MSQTPANDRRFLDDLAAGASVSPQLGAGVRFFTAERPEVIGEDRRGVWRKMSDWIFDGILPDSAPKFYGDPATLDRPSAEMKRLQEKTRLRQRDGQPFIDKHEGDARRLAADMLIGLADEGTLPLRADPVEDFAAEMLVDRAMETIESGAASPAELADAEAKIQEQALLQTAAKQDAEQGLSTGATDAELTRRLVELWADGKPDEEAIGEMQAGGWEFSKVSKAHMDRLAEEIEILMDEGEFGKAKALTMARLNLMKGGGPADVNATPYDDLLDAIVAGQTQNLTRAEAFSIAGTDAFLSTIRGLGRLTGVGYATPKDKDILEKMTAASFEQHPVTSLAGSFAGGFTDPVFFGVSMGIAKAPITAASKARYAQSLVARGLPTEVAEQMAKRATLETIATHRLQQHFLRRGLSDRIAQQAASLVWNASDAMATNAAAEGIVAAGEGASPLEIVARAGQGGVTGLAMGVVLDRAFRGIESLSRATQGTFPRETGRKLDAVTDLMARQPEDAQQIGAGLRRFMQQARAARNQLGRRLTPQETAQLAQAAGLDLGDLAARSEQLRRRADRGEPAMVQPGDLDAEAMEAGILREGEANPTPEEQAAIDAEIARQADEAEAGVPERELDADALERNAKEAGIVREGERNPTPEEQAAIDEETVRGGQVDQETVDRLVEKYRRMDAARLERVVKGSRGEGQAEILEAVDRVRAERREQSARFPDRVTIEELGRIEAPSADTPGIEADAEGLDAAAKFQVGNLEQLDHRGDDWVKVRVPIEEIQMQRTGVETEAEVDAYRGMNPMDRPPPAVGPVQGKPLDEGKSMLIADGQRRLAAAQANGETEIVAYVPAWYAKERGFTNLPEHLRRVTGPAKKGGKKKGPVITDRTPEGYGPGEEQTPPLPTPDEVDDALGTGPDRPRPEPPPLPTPDEVDDALGRVDEYIRETELESMDDDELAELRRTMLPKIGSPSEAEGARLAVRAIDRVMAARKQTGPKDRGTPAPPAAPAPFGPVGGRTSERPSGVAEGGRQTKGARTNAPPPPPSRQPAVGRETVVALPDGESLRARYAIVESEDLIPSHDARAGFRKNAYGDINERPYEDPSEGRNLREGVQRIADNPQPAFLLTATPSPLDGPPIVTPDLVALGGNARAMAQQLIYSRGGASMDRINAATREAAARFGIDPAAVDAFQEPILVRVVDRADVGAPGELSRVLNQGLTAARTPDADAVSRGGRLDADAIRRLDEIIGAGTLGDVFNSGARTSALNRTLFESGAFTIADLDAMTDNRGLLTQAGRRTVENAMLGAAIPDIRRLAEVQPAMRNTLIRALPALAGLRRSLGEEWTTTLGNALDIINEYRSSGARSMDDLLSQSSMMPQPWRDDPMAMDLARAMMRDTPTTIAARLRQLASAAADRASGQGRMFGGTGPADLGEILRRPLGDDAQSGLDFGGLERSSMSTGGPNVPRGTRRTNLVDDPQLGLVPADDNRRMSKEAGPASGVDPGLERQPGPDWLRKPPTTKAGKRAVGRLRSDPKGLKYGTRSIAEGLSRVLQTFDRQTREQTGSRHPAHYQPRGHLIRTRSSAEPAWMFHEQGHAISAIIRDANPRFLKQFEKDLVALTQWPGSFASAKSAEEGFAEFIRRYITQPARIEEWEPGPRILAAVESANPKLLAAVRDAARAFDVYMARDLPARWRSYAKDVRKKPFSPVRVINRAMTDFVSRGWAAEQAQNEVLRVLRKEGGLPTMRKVREELVDTAADMRQAYQSLNHIGQMVGVALEGPGGGEKGGLRVHATVAPASLSGTAFDRPRGMLEEDPAAAMLGDTERRLLEAAGFKLPEEPKKHGEIVVLAGKSVKEAIAPVDRAKWDDFETYGQMKATLARIEARRKAGESFPYQTQGEGAKPADLSREITRYERENPEFLPVFKDLEEISSAALLLQVMSGESTVEQAIKAKLAFEHYLPLTRQGEGGPRGIGSGATASPTAGINRSRGSVNPAEPILMAMARKIEQAVNAYYWNRFAMSPIIFAETMRERPDVPFMARHAADRVASRLQLDTVKVATATPDEVRKAIYDYIVEQVNQGNTMFNIEPEELASLSPDDISVTDGFDLWRRKPPKAINVIAPTIRGQRLYYQVLDEDLYRIFSDPEQVVRAAQISEALFGQATQGLKNQITQSFAFAIRSLARDPLSAVMFGQDPGALVPGYYHAIGTIAMLSGRKPETMADPELLSRVFRQVTPEDFARQRSKSMELLTEGLVPHGWRDMNLLRRTLSAPGIAYRVLTKPIEMFQVLTGQRALANYMESAPRIGAYVVAKRKGLSDEAAQLAADTVTGNFSERPLSATAHSLYRTSGFTNPMMQIFGQTARFAADPDPKRVASTAAVRMGGVAGFTALVWAVNRLLSTEEDRRRNAERTEAERLTHMDLKGVRVPFDYGIMGGIQSLTWNTLDRAAGERGVSGDAIARKVISETAPSMLANPTELLPMSIQAGLEAKVNYSFFRQEPIEPPYMQYLEPGERFYDSTPDLYRWIGRAANVSPIRTQYLVRNAFGVQLDNATRMLDLAEEGLDLEEMADLPNIGSLFTRDPQGWNSRSVQEASDLARRHDQLRARLERMEETGSGDPETVEEIRRILARLDPVKAAMLEVGRMWDASKDAAETDPEAARELRQRMIDVARQGLIDMEEQGSD